MSDRGYAIRVTPIPVTVGGDGTTLRCDRSAAFGQVAVASTDVAVLRMFAAAREAAGTSSVVIAATTVGEVLAEARNRFGTEFADVLDSAKVWLDGEPADITDSVDDRSEVAVLPPVSGGG